MPPSKHCLWPEMPPLRKQVRRWFWRWRLPRDPWERLEAPVDFRELAAGAGADFRDYFKGACLVEPADLAELCGWLHACRFVTDERQFGKSEHWQHPVEFEQRRCGDCEDHALWAWRKLAEMGLAVEFVVGLHDPQPNHCWCNHAWLHVQAGPRLLLLETTAARREGMLMDLESARHCYLPTASIDHRFRTCCFANYYHVRATGKAMKLR